MKGMKTLLHDADVCVVGGGLAGLCAAISSARHGAKTILYQERPMLGGNASSEIRMWVCGAQGRGNRETGILEELYLENQFRNADKNYSIWDSVLWAKAANETNLTTLLNCTVCDCKMNANTIVSVRGWQMTTQKWHETCAKVFIDCSGDSILAPLSGAGYFMGREGRDEFNESIAPVATDHKTMGMSCLIQARQEMRPSAFIAPNWAYRYTLKDLKNRLPDLNCPGENFWYLELGGEGDSIADSEEIRDELLKTAFGIWDYIKNAPENKEKNQYWRLDFLGMLPGKRESRRYEGLYIMNQRDLERGGKFNDIIAYGGWPMDDHPPTGFLSDGPPTALQSTPSPYGIPYRCLCSRNIPNLMFAGRNISVTHAVLSSTRVMATCAILGQAAGAGAAFAVALNLTPGEVYPNHIPALQQSLLYEDCWLPGLRRELPDVIHETEIISQAENAELLRDGFDRDSISEQHGSYLPIGIPLELRFHRERNIRRIRLVFDSDLDRQTLPEEERILNRFMLANRFRQWPDSYVPTTMTKAYRLEAVMSDHSVQTLFETSLQYQRLCIHKVNVMATAIYFTPLATWGAEKCHLFSIDVDGKDGEAGL